AMIVTRTGHAVPGRASFIASIAFVAGTAIGPLVAGGAAQFVPGPLALPYVVHLGLLAYGWVRVERLGGRGTPTGPWRPTWPHVPRSIRAAFASAAASGFLAWTAAGIFLALGPSLLAGYGLGSHDLGSHDLGSHDLGSHDLASTTAAASHTIGLPSALGAMAVARGVEPAIGLLSAAVVGHVLPGTLSAA